MKKLFSLLLMAATLLVATAQTPAPDKVGMELTAQQWNRNVVAGWNLGNSLESAPGGWDGNSTNIGWSSSYDTSAETSWGNPKTTKAMIDAVKAAGFNAVRIPVRWGCHITDVSTMTISEAWIKRVKEVVDYCIQNDMYVILNTHHDMWLEYQATPGKKADNNKKLALLWTNIANYFADYDGHLAFAGTNEVHMKDDWNQPSAGNLAVQNSYLQTFVDAVRATGGKNYYRHLIVQTWACNPYYGLGKKLVVPKDVEEHGYERMSVEFHYYNPYNYCAGNQGAGNYNYWGKNCPTEQKTAIATDNETTMTNFFNQVDNEWSKLGLGIVVGEWGISDRYPNSLEKGLIHDNMTYYCTYLTREVRQRGYSAFVWDNNVFGNGSEKFGVFNRSSSMAIAAPWIVKGIMEGAGQEYAEPSEPERPQTGGDDLYSKVGETVWSGHELMAWGDGLQLQIPASYFANLKAGDLLVLYYDNVAAAEYSMVQFFYGDWKDNPQFDCDGTSDFQFDTRSISSTATATGSLLSTFKITTSSLATLKAKGMVLQGFGAYLNRVVLVQADKLGIEAVNSDAAAMTIRYDIQGRRVNQKSRGGITIVNGQKVVIR